MSSAEVSCHSFDYLGKNREALGWTVNWKAESTYYLQLTLFFSVCLSNSWQTYSQTDGSSPQGESWVTHWGEPKDALHQVVAFNLTVLMFVLGLLLGADVTPKTALSKMFCSLSRHWAELYKLLKFQGNMKESGKHETIVKVRERDSERVCLEKELSLVSLSVCSFVLQIIGSAFPLPTWKIALDLSPCGLY